MSHVGERGMSGRFPSRYLCSQSLRLMLGDLPGPDECVLGIRGVVDGEERGKKRNSFLRVKALDSRCLPGIT